MLSGRNKRMSISMIGIDYNKANVDIRAMFSFTKKNATAAMERLKKMPGIQGCVSSCPPATVWNCGRVRSGLERNTVRRALQDQRSRSHTVWRVFCGAKGRGSGGSSVSSDQWVKIHDSGGRSDHHTGQGCADAGKRGLCDG